MNRTLNNNILSFRKKAPAIVLMLLFQVGVYAQVTYYSRINGDWNVASTWSTISCGGAAAGAAPGPADHAVICAGNTVTIVMGGVTITDLTVNSGGVVDDNNKSDVTVNGNLVIDGTYTGQKNLIVTGGAGVTVDGIGNITTTKNLQFLGNASILAAADLSVLNKVDLANGVVVTNNGTITIGDNLDGSNASSEWINATGSTVRLGKNVMTIGILTASADNNLVEYFRGNIQNITTPSASTYHDLTISGLGIKSMLAGLTIEGDLNIVSGEMDCAGFDIAIAGNWTNTALFTEQTALVTFNGTGTQVITNSSGETFYDLAITRTPGDCGMSLANDVTVSNILTMNSGNIKTVANILTLGTDITNEGTLTYVSGQVIGKFRRWIDGGSTGIPFLFPVGSCSNYNYAEPSFNNIMGTGGTLSVEFIASAPGINGLILNDGGTTIYNTFVDGYWDFTFAALNTNNFDLDLAGNGFTAFPIDAATRILTRPNAGAAWTAEGTHPGTGFNPIAKRTGLSTVSAQYCLGDDTNCSGPVTGAVSGQASVCTGVTENYQVAFSRTLLPYVPTADFNVFFAPFDLTYLNDGTQSGTVWGPASPTPIEVTLTFAAPVIADSVSVRVDCNLPSIDAPDSIVFFNGSSAGTRLNGGFLPCTPGMVGFAVGNTVPNTVYTMVIYPSSSFVWVRELEIYGTTSTFTWAVTGGAISSGQGEAGITVDWGATGMTGNVSVIENNGCTFGAQVDYPVTIHSIQPPSITGNSSIPENTIGVAYSVVNTPGYVYNWVISGGTTDPAPASGQGTNSITVNWGATGSGSVQVTADSGMCATSAPTSIPIKIYDIIESIITGNWNQTTTWDCACVPLLSDNVRINNTHTVTLVADTRIDNLIISGGGELDAAANNKKMTVSGDIVVNGLFTGGTRDLILTGINTEISGSGGAVNISGGGMFQMKNGNKAILSSTVLNVKAGNFDVNDALIIMTNNGKITIVDNLICNGGTNNWINAANSTLNVGGTVMTGGVLTAIASGNLVRYMGTGAQNVVIPAAQTYYDLTLDSAGIKTVSAGGTTIYVLNDFIVDNTAVGVLAGGLDVGRDLKVQATGQLDAGAGNYPITLYGNWLANGTNPDPFIERAGTVTLTGSTDQMIDNPINDERFYNLTVNKPGGKVTPTVTTDVTIVNNLNFTQGIIEAPTIERVNFLDNATATGGNANSYIDGAVKKLGNDAFIFPTGDGTKWARIGISAPTPGSEFTAQYIHADYGSSGVIAPLINVSKMEYWTLDRTPGSGDVTVELFWENAGESGIDDCADLTVAHWNSGLTLWDEKTGTASGICSGSGSGSVKTNAVVSTFSPFTFGSRLSNKNPLPVELLTFNAELNGEVVDVNWSTLSESNNDFFTVERSVDGVDFEFLTYVKGAGTSNSIRNYMIIDDQPIIGASYYRLKQTDFDGESKTFDMVAVNYNPENGMSIAVYPNPTYGTFWVDVAGHEGDEILVVVLDMLGQEHFSRIVMLEENGYTLAFDPSDKLASGVYMVIGSSANKLYSKKLVIR